MTDHTPLPSGVDASAIDPAVRPQDDLFRHVNGTWLRDHVIPADRAVDGAFRHLADEVEINVRAIVEELGARVAAPEGAPQDAAGQVERQVAQQVGGVYASFLDTERIESLGLTPLAADLEAIAAAPDATALARVIGALQREGGPAPIAYWVDNDSKDPEKYVVYLHQAGLGLPDESYYREEQYAPIREAYRAHVARVLALAGLADEETAENAAEQHLALETELATHHWDVVKDRDADLTYNPTTFAELAASAPGFDWDGWLAALDVPSGAFDDVVVREPSYPTGFAALWSGTDLATWKTWASFHLVRKFSPFLHDALVQANFDFYSRTLTGTQELRERWKRGVGLVEGALGEAVGRLYVERHFPPSHKAHMDELVANLVEAYRQSITTLEWMGEDTRRRALDKLDAFTPKIGYPVRWRDYSALVIDAGDLVGNVRRSNVVDQLHELRKIGRPIDRDEWFMTPQTVNAYYNPGMNEIVFPAAILQPPFFDPDVDDAVNYGGIGGVIGHEIGHGFDDQGSKYDGSGRLEDWWTEQDREEFEKRTSALIAQYDAFVPEQLGPDGQHVNGALTIGENIGDLGGLTIALKAYAISLGGSGTSGSLDDAPVIDGLTGAQRVFLGWAQVWQTKIRDEALLQRIATDPHSPAEFRCNGVVRNLAEFHEAFDVRPGDALYLAPEERVAIW